MDEVVKAVREYLWNNDELLKDEYSDEDHPLAGHCYVAAESVFHILGGYEKFEVYRMKQDGYTHWFLKDKDTGEIVDPTGDQFDEELDYSDSVKTGFLTKEPSNRSKKVINKVINNE